MGLFGDGLVRLGTLERQPPAGDRTSPATMRSSDDLPAPLRPVTSRASPAANRKLKPANTSRPPRTQARPLASSRIAARPAGNGAKRPWYACNAVPHLRAILVCLAERGKSPYKPEGRAALDEFRARLAARARKAIPGKHLDQRPPDAPASGMEYAAMTSLDSFNCCRTLKVGSKTYAYYSLPLAEKNGLKGISRLPFSMKVLLENLLRNEDGRTVTKEDIQAFAKWLKTKTSDREIAFRPARVLMQDFTGVPAVVDLAAMRDAMKHLGGDREEDQSAGAGRSRHRPFGRGQLSSATTTRSRRTSRKNTSRTRSATNS